MIGLPVFGLAVFRRWVFTVVFLDGMLVKADSYCKTKACCGCYNRPMAEKLLLVPWFMGILYGSIPLFWFAIHPFADRWRKMSRSPYRALLPLWAVIILALSWAAWPWRSAQIYFQGWTWALALPFFAL